MQSIDELLDERQLLTAQISAAPVAEREQLRARVSVISARIQRLTRAQAIAQAGSALACIADARLQWTHSRERDGVPFAGRARYEDFVLNYAAGVREGALELSLVLHYRHPVGQLAAERGRFSLPADHAELEADIASLAQRLASRWP
jgi:hypothetical protein